MVASLSPDPLDRQPDAPTGAEPLERLLRAVLWCKDGPGCPECAKNLRLVGEEVSRLRVAHERLRAVEYVLERMVSFTMTKPSPQQTRQKSAREMVELFAQDLRAALKEATHG